MDTAARFLFDGNFGVVVGGPTLWTWDGGRSWVEVNKGLSLTSVVFFKTGKALAVGYRGVIVLAP